MGNARTYTCQPAHRIIALLGGSRTVAGHCGLDVGTVNRWRRPARAGGCDGEIPRRYRGRLIALAASGGRHLGWADFVWIGPGDSATGESALGESPQGESRTTQAAVPS